MTEELDHSIIIVNPIFWDVICEPYLISINLICPLSSMIPKNELYLPGKNYICCSNSQLVEQNCKDYLKSFLNHDLMLNSKSKRIRLRIDALTFSFIMYEMNRSETFRKNILKRYLFFTQGNGKDISRISNLCPLCQKPILLVWLKVILNLPEQNILDIIWNKKIKTLVNERCELENAMAWLSTLGGAFSALGDEYMDCAEKAGLISVQQFQLALRLGDPITLCRCKIYFAMSLLQKEQYSRAKRLIRELYKFSTSPEGSKDFRLKNMCIAVWNRLKYVLFLRKKTSHTKFLYR